MSEYSEWVWERRAVVAEAALAEAQSEVNRLTDLTERARSLVLLLDSGCDDPALQDDILWYLAQALGPLPGDALAEQQAVPVRAPEGGETTICTRCGDPIADGYMIGDGDGAGRRFAHPECYRQYPGAYKERDHDRR